MGFLGRVGASLAGNAIAKWVIGIGAAAAVAGVIAFGAFMYMKGGLANDAKWLASLLKWERQQIEDNKAFDSVTVKKNQSFSERLMENEQKWRINSAPQQ